MARIKKILTEAVKVQRYLVHHFRLAWRFYSEKRKDCLKAKTCEACKRLITQKVNKAGKYVRDVAADHIIPVVDPKTGFNGWDDLFARMFGGQLQALCGDCHSAKSKLENSARRKHRNDRLQTS